MVMDVEDVVYVGGIERASWVLVGRADDFGSQVRQTPVFGRVRGCKKRRMDDRQKSDTGNGKLWSRAGWLAFASSS